MLFLYSIYFIDININTYLLLHNKIYDLVQAVFEDEILIFILTFFLVAGIKFDFFYLSLKLIHFVIL